MYRGSCACGATKWTATAAPVTIKYCHCIKCRKVSGAPFLACANFAIDAVTWNSTAGGATPFETAGSLRVSSSSKVALRAWCKECGSPMFMKYRLETGRLDVVAGTMDEDSARAGPAEVRGSAHIFTSQKASWYEIGEDGLERFERFPPGFQEQLDEWERSNGASDG